MLSPSRSCSRRTTYSWRKIIKNRSLGFYFSFILFLIEFNNTIKLVTLIINDKYVVSNILLKYASTYLATKNPDNVYKLNDPDGNK